MNAICQFCGFDMTTKSEYERIGHESTHLWKRLEDERAQELLMERAFDPQRQSTFDAYLAKQELLHKQIAARLEAALERQR